jgi:hypothetical protein
LWAVIWGYPKLYFLTSKPIQLIQVFNQDVDKLNRSTTDLFSEKCCF